MGQAQLSSAFAKLDQRSRERVTKIALNATFEKPVISSFPLDGRPTLDRSMASAGNGYNTWMPRN